MIIQTVYLEDYDWLIKVYYAVNNYYTDEILEELDSIDCSKKVLKSIDKLITKDTYNWGITYTNEFLHVTIIVIGKTTTAEEFLNTLDHEKGHAATHIAQYYDLNPYDELFLYLQGLIGQKLYKKAKKLLCERCRKLLLSDCQS